MTMDTPTEDGYSTNFFRSKEEANANRDMKASQGVLIVEDEPLVAEDIAGHLLTLGFKVADLVHSAEEAIEFLKNNEVSAVLLDITLAGELDGIDVAHFINAMNPVPFIFLTSHADTATVQRVKETRPGGYLVKPFDENDLYTSLEMALTNYFILHPPKVTLDVDWLNERLVNKLSEREFDILMAIKGGNTNAQVADQLHVSVNTVKTHLQNVYSKLDVKNRTEALFRLNQILNSN